jgi:methionyl aminopeptidase
MIYLKNKAEIEKMKVAGKFLAELFQQLPSKIFSGLSTKELDTFIETFILSKGMVPVCKGYYGYPAASCISVNDVVVHGVPNAAMILQDGDLVKVDVVASFQGYCADMARGFVVGSAGPFVSRLNKIAEDSFLAGLAMIRPGNFVHDISAAVQNFVEKKGAFVVREFVGHGIGKAMHEDPQVPNFVTKGPQVKLVAGMVLALEPMVLESSDRVVVGADGWTARSRSGVLASHYEDTVLVTNNGCLVLTSAV